MTNLILSTSNVMIGGPSVIRRPTQQKSNIELISGLRSNISAAQEDNAENIYTNGEINSVRHIERPPLSTWIVREKNNLYIPAVDWTQSGLQEERSGYDITVKLFYLPGVSAARRCEHTRDAIALVLRDLGVKSVDLFIASFPSLAFDSDTGSTVSDETNSGSNESNIYSDSDSDSEPEPLNTTLQTWRTLEALQKDGVIRRLGVAEFCAERLERFLKQVEIKPSVNQINLRDCCSVPAKLSALAKKEGIELFTHNDCTDILPPGTLRELLGAGENGLGVLADPEQKGDGLVGDVQPQWVIKYTAVVEDRGVIESKGYFAVALLTE